MRKLFLIFGLFSLPLLAQVVINGNVAISGNLTCEPGATPAPGTPIVTVSAGMISFSNCPGDSYTYTTDGSPATIASTLYSAPFAVPGTTTTYHVVCADIVSYQNETQTSIGNIPGTGIGYKCVTPNTQTYGSLTCAAGGGVTGQPTNVALSFGSTMNYTQTSTGAAQSLIPYFGTATSASVDSCDHYAQDKYVEAVGTSIQNNELDGIVYNSTYNVNHQIGLQANQQSSGTGHGQWEIDADGGTGWVPTGYTTAIPLSTSAYTHIGLTAHWVNGDTSLCGGSSAAGCLYYDDLYVNGVDDSLASLGGQPQSTTTFRSILGNQDQLDATSAGGTIGRNIQHNTVACSAGAPSAQTTFTYNPGVASPTLSVAAGAVAPGTATTASDATSGATIFYTWDGTTPAYEVLNGQYVPTGTTMEYRPGDYPSGFAIYGPKTFNLLAAKSGMTDSAVATYAYTLSAPTGTAISACQTLAASTTYYLTANVSSSGTCFPSGGNGWKLNLNGHTVTYGTGHTPLVNVTNATTNGSTTVSVASGTPFATCPTGDTIMVNDLSQNNVLTTVASCPTSSSVVLASAAAWSSSGNSLTVWPGSATYGIQCDGSVVSGCVGAQMYNGTITQAANINPFSQPVLLGSYQQYGDNGTNIVSDVTFNVNSQDSNAILVNASPTTYGLGDLIQFNTINDSATVISTRDEFYGTPIFFTETGGATPTSPVSTINDNVLTESPQGSLNAQTTVNAFNNNFNAGTNIEYVGGYGVFLNKSGSLARGNNISGWQRGLELECSTDCTMDQNVVNTTDSANVHDPHHNPVGCEIGGNDAFRVKNYGQTGNICLGNYTSNVLSNNILTTTENACPAQGMRFSQMNSGDTGTISGNQVTLVMDAAPSVPSGAYSADSGGNTCQEYMNGYTFSGNTQTVSGPYSADGLDISFDTGGASGWTQGNFATPLINSAAPSSLPSGGTFTGSGTATMHCTGSDVPSVTYNGTSVPCS